MTDLTRLILTFVIIGTKLILICVRVVSQNINGVIIVKFFSTPKRWQLFRRIVTIIDSFGERLVVICGSENSVVAVAFSLS